jgi:hypothetical protein
MTYETRQGLFCLAEIIIMLRTHPLESLTHVVEEDLQVVGHCQHRVRPAATGQELQIVVEQGHAKSDNRSNRRAVRVDQPWSDGRHAGALLSSWITGLITGEMFTVITHISSN